MAITLTLETLTAVIAEVEAVDVKLATVKGTVTERTTAATAALKAADPDLFSHVEALEAQLAIAKQAIADAVAEALKSTTAKSATEVESLKVTRTELVENANALATLLKVAKPSFGKAPRSSNPRSTGAKVSKGFHYIMQDGARFSYANDSLSYLAFGPFKSCGTENLKAALQSIGVTELTKSWGPIEVTVGEVTATIGFEVVEATVPATVEAPKVEAK